MRMTKFTARYNRRTGCAAFRLGPSQGTKMHGWVVVAVANGVHDKVAETEEVLET